MNGQVVQQIKTVLNATDLKVVEVIQELWSGYGQIVRVELKGAKPKRVIVKNIDPPSKGNHPRGWNTNTSHQRKLKSYQVEMEWYNSFAAKCKESFRVPTPYFVQSNNSGQIILLEDLDDVGYELRQSWLTPSETKVVLKWLANFHAAFMGGEGNGLWAEGCYWHLDTRPDEWQQMESSALKNAAGKIDQKLKQAKFQTLVHGDAKVANFCFTSDKEKVAAVDFQYVGKGCGMKDVAYFLGSCLTEVECEKHESELLDVYFSQLRKALDPKWNASEVEEEWRGLYSIAWADFTRFLLGWMPGHHKINGYSLKMVDKALNQLN